MTPLESILPYVCLGLLAIGLFGFVESLPFGAPRESLADRLRQLEPEYWANLAQEQHSAALRPMRVGHSILRPVVDELGRQLQAVLARVGFGGSSGLEQQLELLRPGVTPAQHFGEKVVLALLGLGVLPGCEAIGIHPFGSYPVWTWIALGVVGFAAPDWYLAQKFEHRRARIVMELPTVLSMLAIAISAGGSIEEAVARVADSSDGTLARELQRVRRELRFGQRYLVPALLALAERNRVPELYSVVGHIQAASRLGLPLVHVRTQATALRERKRLLIAEEGVKGSIRMIAPVALFILPVLFVVLLGPAAASIASWAQ
ncbi:MAG TPA: type II secretion system F family protein [Chloroflexota bacterium]